MGYNKGRNYRRSNNWSSQDGINQKHTAMIKSRARSNYKSKRTINPESSINPSPSSSLSTNFATLDINVPNNKNGFNNLTSGLMITGIVIGSLIVLVLTGYFIIRFIKKRKKSSDSQKDQEEEELPHPHLTINFVKHNHPIPELCTTPDTQPILDYYSSKAGLTDGSSPHHIINSNKLNHSINEDINNNDHKSTPIEINDNKPSEENEYVPQYYNGMEIPPLGARIIPLERQVQIAKELTSVNLSPTKHKRKSNRSISSILSISSRRKSSTSNTFSIYHNNNYINNNSSTTNSLTQISETPPSENAANPV